MVHFRHIPLDRRTVRAMALGLVLAHLTAAPTLAQPASGTAGVYRCEGGRYSDRPCPGGRSLAVEAAPSADRQRQAHDTAAREARLAEQLRQERLAGERAAAGQRAMGIGPARPAAAPASAASVARHGKRKRHHRHRAADDHDSRRAIGPAAPPNRR